MEIKKKSLPSKFKNIKNKFQNHEKREETATKFFLPTIRRMEIEDINFMEGDQRNCTRS